jgi:galactose mutarotase-like enzyme
MIENGVEFSLVSKDGDDGWPGTVKMTATYTLVGKSATSADFKL